MTEQRKAIRYEVNVSAEVYTGDNVFSATTRNLSETGVCVDLDYELKEGSIVGISLFLTTDGIEDPDIEPLNIKAEVIWCTEREDTGFSAGSRFQGLTEKHTTELKHFLTALG